MLVSAPTPCTLPHPAVTRFARPQSMGKSLTFRGAVYEATDKLRRHRCRDSLCQNHMNKVG